MKLTIPLLLSLIGDGEENRAIYLLADEASRGMFELFGTADEVLQAFVELRHSTEPLVGLRSTVAEGAGISFVIEGVYISLSVRIAVSMIPREGATILHVMRFTEWGDYR